MLLVSPSQTFAFSGQCRLSSLPVADTQKERGRSFSRRLRLAEQVLERRPIAAAQLAPVRAEGKGVSREEMKLVEGWKHRQLADKAFVGKFLANDAEAKRLLATADAVIARGIKVEASA